MRLGCLSNSILNLKTFWFLDMCGDIPNATSIKLSGNSNSCFNTSIQGEDSAHQIKVNLARRQTFFL